MAHLLGSTGVILMSLLERADSRGFILTLETVFFNSKLCPSKLQSLYNLSIVDAP